MPTAFLHGLNSKEQKQCRHGQIQEQTCPVKHKIKGEVVQYSHDGQCPQDVTEQPEEEGRVDKIQ